VRGPRGLRIAEIKAQRKRALPSAHTINGVHPNAEKRTNVEVLIGHPMLKAEAAEKLSCWPKIYLGG
jgi:hypothetical protein